MRRIRLLGAILLSVFLLCACTTPPKPNDNPNDPETIHLTNILDYSGEPYVILNDNQPEFSSEDLTTNVYEHYSELDELGRGGVAVACIGKDIMPTEDRESISHIVPSGWVQAEYEHVDGKHLYNRCHLIGFQLTGENANERNLITRTRYLKQIVS